MRLTARKMKMVSIAGFGLLAIMGHAFAVNIAHFKSWDDLTKKSPDIVIAKCVATPDLGIVITSMTWSDIEVLSTLKGDTKLGTARMLSLYGPCQGEQILLFSHYQQTQHERVYHATETYRVVPLDRHFLMSELVGKTLDQQIQLGLRHKREAPAEVEVKK